jgi:hypothetical protein
MIPADVLMIKIALSGVAAWLCLASLLAARRLILAQSAKVQHDPGTTGNSPGVATAKKCPVKLPTGETLL